jgi:hypothetical protein
MKKTLGYVKTLLVLAILYGAVFAVHSYAFYYFDPFYGCRISVDSGLRHTRFEDTVEDALKLIKKDSPKDYKAACKHVNQIIVYFCNLDHYYQGEDACYLKGSKVIVFVSKQNVLKMETPEVASLIVKYADRSALYWNNANH